MKPSFFIAAAWLVLTAAVAVAGLSVPAAHAGAPPDANVDDKPGWEGVYAADQVTRGAAVYAAECLDCHGSDLGGKLAPALVGPNFRRRWGGETPANLFYLMKNRIPRSPKGHLSDDEYLHLAAYLLKEDGFELTDGPEPIPDYTLVQVVGCLAQRADGAWTLTKASEPMRAQAPESSHGAELQQAASRPLGTGTFGLQQIHSTPEADKGHKVEAKGVLVKMENDDRIMLTSFQTLAATCEK